MPYIGRGTDKLSNVEVLDNITFDGSSSYTLQKGGSNFTPSSANTLLLSIDGVVQAGNFTVSGSTIDFGTAVAGTSTCDFILHYGVGLITAPSDGTVTTAKLADNSVSLAKLTATGTKDATTFLRGDNTFASAGSPSITDNGNATAITINSSEQVAFTDGTASLPSITNLGDENTGIYFPSDNSLAISTDGTQRLSINSNGTTKIARNGASVDSGDYHQIVGNSSNFYELKILNKASSPASQYITEISFANSSPDGAGAKFMQMRDTTTARVNINSDGDLQNHDNSYGGISDERVKQNIVDAGSQWEDIKNIRVRKYKKKDDVLQYGEANAPLELGVISQELESVSPGLIKEDKADSSHAQLHEDFAGDNPENVKYVKYSILYMKAIKALQEAMERIETLEAKVTTLENE